MTSLFPPFTRRASFRKQPFFYEAGRGVYYKSLGYSSPALNLNFTTGTLDSRITFSRGSNATLVDSTGKITYAPANLLLRSQEFDNAAWFKGNTTVTADQVTAPDGTLTADKVDFAAVANANIQPAAAVTVLNGASYIYSVYARADTTITNVKVSIQGGADVSTSIGTSWQRISVAFTSNATTAAPTLVTRNSAATTIYLWGAQLEPVTYQTTPSTYVATTSSAYYGPRFDYDPVTLACKGLLIEEQRTNSLTYSSDYSNAVWSKTNVTITPAATTSPSGVLDAQKLAATASAATNMLSSTTVINATSATYSIYVKQGTGATTANLFALRNVTTATVLILGTLNYSTGVWTYSTGSSGVTVTNAGNGWWRLQITATSGITSGDGLTCYVGWGGGAATAGDFLYAWGAQLETGSFATSYIPTTTATVTRSADAASMTGSNFSSWYNQSQGTCVFSGDFFNPGTNGPYIMLSSSGNFNPESIGAYNTGNQFQIFARSSSAYVANFTPGNVTANVAYKGGFAYEATSMAASINGSAVTSATPSGAMPSTLNALNIYVSNLTGTQSNGHIASIQYYNKRLPNATLQQLTLPSLVPSMSLVFDTSSNSYIDANWSP